MAKDAGHRSEVAIAPGPGRTLIPDGLCRSAYVTGQLS